MDAAKAPDPVCGTQMSRAPRSQISVQSSPTLRARCAHIKDLALRQRMSAALRHGHPAEELIGRRRELPRAAEIGSVIDHLRS
jgi:hypothetical protein